MLRFLSMQITKTTDVTTERLVHVDKRPRTASPHFTVSKISVPKTEHGYEVRSERAWWRNVWLKGTQYLTGDIFCIGHWGLFLVVSVCIHSGLRAPRVWLWALDLPVSLE